MSGHLRNFEGVGEVFPQDAVAKQKALQEYMKRQEENEDKLLAKIKEGYVEPGTKSPAEPE